MSPDTTVTPTPGVDRVIRFSIGGAEFGFRRPSRADVSEAWRIVTRKLAASGHPTTLDYFDGDNLHWEARLEVGLQARVRAGVPLDLGERAPSHWLVALTDRDGKVIGHVVDFAEVDPDEFALVVEHLKEELKKKAPSLPSSSIATAAEQTNG